MGFYVQHNSQQLGPYTLAELRSQLASGALSLRDPVWWQGQAEWIPLAESSVFDPGFKDPTPARKTAELEGRSPFAMATLIMALISLICGPFTSVPTIVLGHCAFSELRQNPKMTGRSAARTGLIMGYIITLIYALLIGAYFYFQDDITRVTDREEAIREATPPPALPAAPARAPAISPAVNSPAGTNTPSAMTGPKTTATAPQTNAASP
jgi:hypothetical protein